MTQFLKDLLKLEPFLSVGSVQAVLAFVLALPGVSLSPGVTAAILACAAAVAALITGVQTRPVAPALFTGVVTAAGTLIVALGVHGVSDTLISAVNVLILAAFTAWSRTQVTPVASLAKKG